jgi:flagellar biosynthetic protein FliO
VGLFVFVLLLFAAAWYVTRLVGKGYSGLGGGAREMTLIDKLSLGRDRHLLIVRAGEKTLLLGVTLQHIEALAELDGEQLQDLPAPQGAADFFSILKERLKKPEKPEKRD